MIQSVSFIGLGAMGWHMASHLIQVCNQVYVWNRTFAKAKQHEKTFGTQAVDLTQALQADIIFSCLPTSQDVENLIANSQLKQGCIWVDCTSGVPETARKLSQQLKLSGVDYLDAPVSGQTIGAERGTLTVMVGGNESAFKRAKPIIQAFANLVEYVGESGAGFAVKAINNTLMATHLWALAEGLSILKSQGVNLHSAMNCINHSSGKSNVSEHIMMQRVLNRKFEKTFALDLLQKDIGIALNLVTQNNLELPAFSLIQQQFNQVSKPDAQQVDFSAIVKLLEQQNQLELC
ncbi:NAD(P)-dependent oxidoreductase [Acinetobacter pittii]|uniref:NAD(P)-dependent oxidoreductase n=1 Tax=Acinetobacter pittii TaxID=48296 RepID=UPI0009C1429E|nr:NAD(P)-dependent oxidoreductase [Acinetobacter pittii]MCU4401212.1 NAD(P)-dependent oxidoreductase [Acinetobacter pittii]MCU4404778.1 NAD(P)-dependent oxidoreductase [Acinetobacter pittii]MCU4464606.1 NAD(P)-dependent oxidoreductase [Acinetobacter pittii]RZG83395.1 NAD(P)-dependent oxidoreductase [Acinetobacter pittii]RZH54575.1 NAD(P)-dependent oxidoreductase [Acinetobacter pittii]